jgi:8-oxo-dGTP diphosphatase
MQRYNLIIVFNRDESKVLMCFRSKDPYKGKYNFVGGKIDEGENYLDSAYRELFEESGISKNDITIKPYIDYAWHPLDMELKVFVGTLKQEVELVDEIHKLYWMSIDEDFFDVKKFAGEGNIGHMMEIYKEVKSKIS